MTATRLRTPTAVEILPHDAPRSAWLATRQQGIGGSDVPGIVGLNGHASPWQVYMDKIGEARDRQTDAMDWGRRLQPIITEWFSEHTGIPVTPCGLLANTDRPWQRASLDGITPDGIFEAKTTSVFMAKHWAEDQLADDTELQTQHYLDVTGYEHAWVVVLIGGQRPEVREVTRDNRLITQLRDIEWRFWQHVLSRRPPPVDGTESTRRMIDGRWPDVDPESVIVLDPDVIDPLLARRALLKDRADAVKTELTAVENDIRLLLGPREWGVVAGTPDGQPAVTYRWSPRAGYTVAPTRYRKLTIKEIT